MARRLVQWSVLLCVVAGVAFLPMRAEAGEIGRQRLDVGSHKAEMGNARRNVADVTAGAHGAQSAIHRGEVASLTFATTKAATATSAQTAKETERNEAPSQRKTITFFRINNSKLGDVSVQPVVGRVNGAQLSIGF